MFCPPSSTDIFTWNSGDFVKINSLLEKQTNLVTRLVEPVPHHEATVRKSKDLGPSSAEPPIFILPHPLNWHFDVFLLEHISPIFNIITDPLNKEVSAWQDYLVREEALRRMSNFWRKMLRTVTGPDSL